MMREPLRVGQKALVSNRFYAAVVKCFNTE